MVRAFRVAIIFGGGGNEKHQAVLDQLSGEIGSTFRFLDQISGFWINFPVFGSTFRFLDQLSGFWINFQVFGSNFRFLDQLSGFWINF